jgi:DHA2 family multidrug resistance protein-like MFS transporter
MTSAGEAPLAGRREWIGLTVIALPCVLYAMDLTVLNLALPRLSADLRPSSVQLLWIVDIYGFFVAGFLITMGNLGDRIGRRRLLSMGAAAFGVASVLAAFSTSAGMLIAARALLGVAGATLAPSTLSLIRNMFLEPRQRRVAIGVWISSYSVGGAIGPVLGGMLLQHFGWGAGFLLAVPVMVLLLVLGPMLLPEYRDPSARTLDPSSAVLSLVAILSVIYGLKLFAQDGVGWLPIGSVAGGLAVGFVFVRRQRTLESPLIDLRLFRVPAFSVSLATYLLGTFVAFGSYVFIGQYLQLVLGLTPLSSGLWLLPWSGGFIVGSTLAPVLERRASPVAVMGASLALSAVGLCVLTRLVEMGLTGLVIGTILFALGLAPVVTLGTDLIVGAAPPEAAGAAAAISETGSELGGALGIALLGSLGTAVYRAAMAKAALEGIPPEARRIARETLGGATAAAASLSDHAAAELLETARAAFADALQVTISVCAVLCGLTAILAVVLLRRLHPAPAATTGEEQVPGELAS